MNLLHDKYTPYVSFCFLFEYSYKILQLYCHQRFFFFGNLSKFRVDVFIECFTFSQIQLKSKLYFLASK